MRYRNVKDEQGTFVSARLRGDYSLRGRSVQATRLHDHLAFKPSPTEFTMLLDTPNARLTLAHNQMARLVSACNTRVECLSGVAWITVDGDPRDVVLSRGESLVIESAAPVIVHAIQGAADVRLHAKAGAGRCHSAAVRGRSAWRGWFWPVPSHATA
jgi:hypothetical protein